MGAGASSTGSIMDDLRAVSATLKEEAEGAPEVPADSPEVEPDAAPEPSAESAEPKTDKTGRLHGKDGKFAPKAKDEPEEAPKAKPATAPKLAAVPAPKPAETPVAAPAPALKAPSSWKPEVRERFRELPPDVQQEILRREREASTGLGQAAEARKAAEKWQQTVAPYEMLARADGQDVFQKVDGLLRLEASMRTSPEPVKARMVANIIRQYGISVDSLADALNGASAEGPARHISQPEAYRDPRVDQLFAALQQQAQRQQQTAEEEARRELEAFQQSDHPAAEFFDDLKKAAGRLIALAKEDGETLSLQDAFELAASRNPSISKILAQRKAAEDAKARAVDLQRKRAATVGVRGTPPPVEGDDESDGSLRGDLEMMARNLNRRA